MRIRDANYSDTFEVAALMEKAAKGKSTPRICSSRVRQSIGRARQTKKTRYAVALVAVRDKKVVGFLFASEAHAFELCQNIMVMQVHFLVGRELPAMLRRLRKVTKKRIWLIAWGLIGHSLEFWAKYFARMGDHHRVVGHVYEM